MKTLKLLLVDRNPRLVDMWKRSFADCPDVTATLGDLFAEPADVLVSPANSFGVMDGGLDLYIRSTLGEHVEVRARDRILTEHHGELPVGQAEFVETGHEKWPLMAVAPTMRVPSIIPPGYPAAYLALRAVLLGVTKMNEWRTKIADGLAVTGALSRGAKPVESIVCPGLGTGVGKLDPALAANQMRYAYEVWRSPARFMPFRETHLIHAAMTGAPTWPMI